MNSLTLVVFHLLLATAVRLSHGAGYPGSLSPVSDPNSEEIRKIMSSTLGKTNAGYTLSNVKQCTQQIVAGWKYDCEIEVQSPNGQASTCRLAVVQRPWLQEDKEMIVADTCSTLTRAKREVCDGCPAVVDANSAEMKKHLTGVLSQTNSGLSLVKGTHCTAQVVAGFKYDCTIQVESPKTNGVQTCKLVFVDQGWKVPATVVLEDTCSLLVSRNKREVCAGCPVEHEATPEMEKKLTGILGQTNSGLTLVKGEKCTTQVVAGVKYTCTLQVTSPKINGVEKCTISFLEQPWISQEPQVLSDSCSKLTRNKRAVCAGCPIEHDADTPEMKKTLTGILGQTNSGLTLVRGKKCTSQVVSGVKYTCTLEVTSPKINGVETCKISYLEQPWISQEPQVLSDSCSHLTRNKREVCAGCPVEQDPHNPKTEQMMKDTLSQTNSGVNLVSVEKCTTQVVAGVLYDCTIRVNSSHFNGIETCKVQLLSQPWISKTPKVVGNTCAQLTKA